MPDKLRVFVDSDVLIAGSSSTQGASFIVLHLADLTVIECVVSEQIIAEVSRNLLVKLPASLPAFQALADAVLTTIPNPSPEVLLKYEGQADPKDLPILTAAVEYGCRFLLTFNTRHYSPQEETIIVSRPGDFLMRLREHLASLG